MKLKKPTSSSSWRDKSPMLFEENKRKYLKYITSCGWVCLFFILNHLSSNLLQAGIITEIEGVYHWKSANMIVIQNGDMSGRQKAERNAGHKPPLKNYAYNFHFDSYGAPPPLDFIAKLKASKSEAVEIDDSHIKFKKYDKRIPLNRSLIPDWADPAPPYAISVPGVEMVLVVYPYYFYQCKENKYYTQVYSMQGQLLQTFESLPTHVAAGNPYLLISPERSGCCESIRWNFRFYNLAAGTLSQILCPEGFCGDVLFTAVDRFDHYLLIQEVVDSVSGVGAYLQTNIYLVDQQGNVSASGHTVFATTDKLINRETINSAAPFSIRKLMAIDRVPKDGSWRLHYEDQNQPSTLRIQGQADSMRPSALFLQGNQQIFHQTAATFKIAATKINKLPAMLIALPGNYRMTIKSADGLEYNEEVEVKRNTVNKLVVELPK